MDFDLSLDETKKAETIGSLRGMFQSPGWNILDQLLRKNITLIEETILDGAVKDLETLDDLKRRRTYMLKLLNMPVAIYTDLTVSNQEVDFDPYK